MIPVSVIIVTKNEAGKIGACIDALREFNDIWVVDSGSRDGTSKIATEKNVHVVPFEWNGQYPKKRQWCLNNLLLQNDWVFFVDADEIISDDLSCEIKSRILPDMSEAGFFVTGRYRLHDKILRFGLPNKKIALLHRGRMEFPVVDDLDIPGMGEIEGHYQPILKTNTNGEHIGTLRTAMFHHALDDERAWAFRHEKYARWESGMNRKNAWPIDPVPWRQAVKEFLRASSFRAEIVFFVAFILKFGFLDGAAGLYLAKKRYSYLKMINRAF